MARKITKITKTAKSTAPVLNARTIKARAIRAARREQATEILAMAYGISKTEVEYTPEDKLGERVRLTPATRDEARAFLMGRRAYDSAELLEALGKGWLNYMVEKGYAVKHCPNGIFGGIYIITEHGAKSYDLPAKINGGMNANYAKTPAKTKAAA